MEYIVQVPTLAVRLEPSKTSSLIKYITIGTVLIKTESKGNWIKHNLGGWSLIKESNEIYLNQMNIKIPTTSSKDSNSQSKTKSKDKDKDNKPSNKDTTTKENKPKEEKKPELSAEDKNEGLRLEREDDIDFSGTFSPLLSGDLSKNLKGFTGVHGMPYQFLATADPRYGDCAFGRTYTSKIVSKLPVLLMGAGRPLFMDGYSRKQKEDVMTGTILKQSQEDSELDSLFYAGNGKLYTFKYDYDTYYQYVNTMLHEIAGFLDLSKYTHTEWSTQTADGTKSLLSSKENVAFYIDSETQIQESFSNSTTESKLASAVNGLSDMAKEFQFLMGGTSGTIYQDLIDNNLEPALQKITEFTSKYSNIFPSAVIDKITGGFENLVAGGKMSFPEIWSDSEFSRSYDINIKLRSPDGDNESIFLNILVPLIHLIAFAAPQQNGPMGYQSPFLVRAYYKGFFNVDMGMITSLSIDKGDKGKWNLNGLPTEVNISLTIKDLYDVFYISNFDTTIKGAIERINNTTMLDYLANLCGINVNAPDIIKALKMNFNAGVNSMTSGLNNGFMGIENAMSNILNKIFN